MLDIASTAGMLVGVFMGVVVGVKWVYPWWDERKRRGKDLVIALDRKRRDLKPMWVKPTSDGQLMMRGSEGQDVPVPVDADTSWTVEGQGRGWIIDADTKMCMRDKRGSGEEPVIEPPETTETLMEWARGIHTRNVTRGEPEGWLGALAPHMPLMVLMILILVVGLLGIVGFSAMG